LKKTEPPMSYKNAGVDIDASDALVQAIKPLARSTFRDGCLSDLGGFGAMFEVPRHYRDPVLVSGTDGVGTKLKLAFEYDRHDTIGIDLVAMCANDILVQGAEPLFFLDYFASGKLDPDKAIAVVRGIAEGCRLAGAALIGGETAEMPDMYAAGEYDLAGFCVGAVEREKILDGEAVRIGDVVVGVDASGPHSNGYSLIRRVIETQGIDADLTIEDTPLADLLLAPTRIYVKPVLSVLHQIPVHAIAHITGGGLPGNLQRVLPESTQARIDTASWRWPAIFNWLQTTGNIETPEMYRTFNCGIGLVLLVPGAFADRTIEHLRKAGENAQIIGEITASTGDVRVSMQ
jgi:phosphoribosylformylglycinamidine cyclo-ligase